MMRIFLAGILFLLCKLSVSNCDVNIFMRNSRLFLSVSVLEKVLFMREKWHSDEMRGVISRPRCRQECVFEPCLRVWMADCTFPLFANSASRGATSGANCLRLPPIPTHCERALMCQRGFLKEPNIGSQPTAPHFISPKFALFVEEQPNNSSSDPRYSLLSSTGVKFSSSL